MPTGTPLALPLLVVALSNVSGLTKLSTTRLTDGRPSPRLISQWLLWSKSAMSRIVDQVQASSLQCQAPYTCGGVPAAAVEGAAGAKAATAVNAAAVARNFSLLDNSRMNASWLTGPSRPDHTVRL